MVNGAFLEPNMGTPLRSVILALLARDGDLIVCGARNYLGRQRQRREQRCGCKKLLHWLPNSSSGSASTGCPERVLALSLIHISEPTRLGMISYAVFCLKKK